MANRRISMRKIRELVRLHEECGLSNRQIGEGSEHLSARGWRLSCKFQAIRAHLSIYHYNGR